MRQDIFYDLGSLSKETIVQLFQEAKDDCISWHYDILDCWKSYYRQTLDVSFEEAIDKFKATEDTHVVFIHRRFMNDHIEIGYSTFGAPSYFLFVYVNIDRLGMFVEKYKLKVR